jgi:hypothetical protein
MRFRTAPYTITFENLRPVILIPLNNCKAEPLAASHVPKLEELRLGWETTFAMKLALDDKANEAQVRVRNTGLTLNRAAGSVSKAILTITDDNQQDPLYTAYFGGKTLPRFKRRFGPKLTAMRGWIKNLKESEHPTLAALADTVEQAVKAADAAVTMREDVATEKRYFRDVGERRKLIDKTNAVCKSIHGELSRLPHEVPGLPTDFADRFFFSESRDDDDGEEERGAAAIEAAKAKIASLKGELAAAEERLKTIEDEEAAAAIAAAELAAEKAALVALEAEAAEKVAQAAALKAKIEKRATA